MKFNNQYDNPPIMDGEQLSDELITMPDQSLSVREIIDRFTRGQIDPSEYPSVDDGFHDDDTFLENESALCDDPLLAIDQIAENQLIRSQQLSSQEAPLSTPEDSPKETPPDPTE